MDIAQRLRAVRARMEKAGADALWISTPENHRYVTGFNNPDGRVLVTAENAYVFADFRYAENARKICGASFEVIEPNKKIISGHLPEIFAECGAVTVAYEENALVCAEFDRLKNALTGCSFVPFSEELSDTRRIKTADEAEKIAAAQDIADAAFAHILTLLPGNMTIPGDMTEADVAAELEYFMKTHGADGISFETIAVSGRASSSPHATPSQRKLEKGFLTMDFGAEVDGYRSDMTRTVVLGRADAEMKRLYETVLNAQLAALREIGPGKDCAATDKIARDIIDGAGYSGRFGHSLGHGVGLEIHEAPNLSPSASGKVLVPGDVVTVEPGIYIEGKYGCRIEDMVLITDDGAHNFTHSPKELIEI